MMKEELDMGEPYIPWPTAGEEFISVVVYDNCIPVTTHMHDFIEIVFFAKGSCVHRYHSNEAVLMPGDVFIVVPHEAHSYDISTQTVIYNCLFYPEAMAADWNQLRAIDGINNLLTVEPFYRPEQGKQEILHLNPAEASYLESMLKKMIDEQEARGMGHRLALKAYLILILAMLGRAWEKQFTDMRSSYAGKRDMLAEALSHIESNYADDLKIRQLASKAYLSPDYFRKVFKEITGLTPIDYISSVRLAKAASLLEESDLPVTRIAEMVGIGDVNYFSRLFRLKLGHSPSAYRKMNGKC